MHLFFLSIFLSIPYLVYSLSDEELVRRVHNHLVVCDYPSAVEEGVNGLKTYPKSNRLRQATIRAFAANGDERGAFNQWEALCKEYPAEHLNRELIESLSWCVITKAANSSSPSIRILGLLGAFFSQDAKGIPFLKKGMRDDNSLIRKAVMQLISHMHDEVLQDEMLKLFKLEKVFAVRIEMIKAFGRFQSKKFLPILQTVLNDSSVHFEENLAAIEGITLCLDSVDKQRIKELVKSDRSCLRLLGCELITHFDQKEFLELCVPLLSDYHPIVRAKALQTFGLARVNQLNECSVASCALKLLSDSHPLVATTAAWNLMLGDLNQGEAALELKRLLKAQEKEDRYLAAAALSSTGRHGIEVMRNAFYESSDPYIKMNLSLGLIRQRVDVDAACAALFHGLSNQKEQWEWKSVGQFRVLQPSTLKHDDLTPNYPEAVNQLTRLEILEILSFFKHSQAQEALKELLQESNWGLSGMAAALLLTEGNETAADIIRELLKDSNLKIRVQAALLLSLWGDGEEALSTLYTAYKTADRDLKGQILEGIGRVGLVSSLPFLLEQLQDPHQSIRIIAAASILACLTNS